MMDANFIRGKDTNKNSATKLQKLFDLTFNDTGYNKVY